LNWTPFKRNFLIEFEAIVGHFDEENSGYIVITCPIQLSDGIHWILAMKSNVKFDNDF
jgi:hypothetical protein